MAGALEFRKADDVVILLDHGQLRNLARILRLREAPLMSNLGSEVERIKYLDQVNDAHNKLVDLVTASEQHTQRYEQQNNQLKADIAKAIEEYVVLGANWAMQCIRNVLMRLTCVEKLRDQFDGLVVELENKLDQNNQIDVEDLVEKLNKLKYYMWEYANTTRSEQARRRSREFSESLMMQGSTVSYLLSRKASQLGFKPEFEDLEDQQTLQVYMAIINESRRAELPDLYNSDAKKLGIFKKIDIAMLVVNSAVLVCDLFRAGEMPDGMEIAFNLTNGRMLED